VGDIEGVASCVDRHFQVLLREQALQTALYVVRVGGVVRADRLLRVQVARRVLEGDGGQRLWRRAYRGDSRHLLIS
jgi:hypothetical protein